jgi:hypothetical protein
MKQSKKAAPNAAFVLLWESVVLQKMFPVRRNSTKMIVQVIGREHLCFSVENAMTDTVTDNAHACFFSIQCLNISYLPPSNRAHPPWKIFWSGTELEVNHESPRSISIFRKLNRHGELNIHSS